MSNNNDNFILGGREFKALKNSTVENDYWLLAHLRAAGLDRIEMPEEMHPQEFARDLLARMYNSGKLFTLLSGLLIEAHLTGADWTPDLAKEYEDHIKKLTSAEDKQTVQDMAVPMLIGFFTSGVVTFRIIPKSTDGATPETSPKA